MTLGLERPFYREEKTMAGKLQEKAAIVTGDDEHRHRAEANRSFRRTTLSG